MTSPANFACQLFESYLTCQLFTPPFRELLHRASFARLFGTYFARQLLVPTLRELSRLPTSLVNFACQLSRVTPPAHFARQLLESYFTCQLFESYFTCEQLAPTFGQLLHLPTSRANFRLNFFFTCQLFMPTWRVTSPANFSCQLFGSCFTCQLLTPPCRELLYLPTLPANFCWDLLCPPTSRANFVRVKSPANFACQLGESYFTCQLRLPTFRELLHLRTTRANFSGFTAPAIFSRQLFESYFACQLLIPTFWVLSCRPKSTS